MLSHLLFEESKGNKSNLGVAPQKESSYPTLENAKLTRRTESPRDLVKAYATDCLVVADMLLGAVRIAENGSGPNAGAGGRTSLDVPWGSDGSIHITMSFEAGEPEGGGSAANGSSSTERRNILLKLNPEHRRDISITVKGVDGRALAGSVYHNQKVVYGRRSLNGQSSNGTHSPLEDVTEISETLDTVQKALDILSAFHRGVQLAVLR